MRFQKIEDRYLLMVKRGESIVASLEKFCQEEGIKNGFFYGIGAVDEVELAHYSVENKKYSSFKLKEPLELVSLIGNVFLGPKGELIVHAHASLSRPNGEMIGGHLVEGKISGTGEIFFTPLTSTLAKSYDQETGLKILS
ncbi:MAG TPA: PPC domain-containing DNA-binding protein [Clostridia bacterium]|nr:PPC domain-containing DNA-binding protein [Clostridia bacterium]